MVFYYCIISTFFSLCYFFRRKEIKGGGVDENSFFFSKLNIFISHSVFFCNMYVLYTVHREQKKMRARNKKNVIT